jgi:hypothetical protein
MAEGKRPGGLTALAVLNFVFGGIMALLLLAVIALLGMVNEGAKGLGHSVSEMPGAGVIYFAILLGVVRIICLITAGVGYLQQKKFLGRTLGHVYAILGIADTAIGVAMLHTGFGIGAIIGLIYPVLTLILINTTFKDDLVN